jgi:predicted nucleic acid-binding protein
LKKVGGIEALRGIQKALVMGKKKAKIPSGTFVLDCSVAVAWFFEDEANDYAQAVEASLAGAVAIVPALWHLEVANALLVGERRKRATEAKVTTFLELLGSLPITLDDDTATRAWQKSIHLARGHRLSVYDAAYLEIALRRGLALATLDDRLAHAAEAAGVPSYEP